MKAMKTIAFAVSTTALALVGLTKNADAESARAGTTSADMRGYETTARSSGYASDRSTQAVPNRAMLRSGVWTLTLGYVPAAAVAFQSHLPVDDKLFIPVAGPWMNYATRDCPQCTHETMNRVLLVTDGIVQGIGALQILGSFLFVAPRAGTSAAVVRKPPPPVQFSPARLGKNGYGLSARGNF